MLDVKAVAGGSQVKVDERPANAVLPLALGPLGHMVLAARNRRALRDLKRLAEAAVA